MPACNRNFRRGGGYGRVDTVVVRDGRSRRGARETVAEELYNTPDNSVVTHRCCDSLYGCREIDARRHNGYWPSFAHPRWLTCAELNNRRICGRCRRSRLR